MQDNLFKSNPKQTDDKEIFTNRELGPFGLGQKILTKEEMETYVQLDHLYDKEQIIRQTATEIAKAAVSGNSEHGNLSANDTARWSVILATCLVKYSKEAAENENFLNECTEEDDYFFGPMTMTQILNNCTPEPHSEEHECCGVCADCIMNTWCPHSPFKDNK